MGPRPNAFLLNCFLKELKIPNRIFMKLKCLIYICDEIKFFCEIVFFSCLVFVTP